MNRVGRAIKSGDTGNVTIAKAKRVSLLIKTDQVLIVVRARLKRIYAEATNMATESHVEELKNSTDKHITNVCLKLCLL